jgi:hypothetical protein
VSGHPDTSPTAETVMNQQKIPRRLRIRVPFRIQQPSVGLGDVVKRVTAAVGFRPCSACQKRAEALNRMVQFTGKPKPR